MGKIGEKIAMAGASALFTQVGIGAREWWQNRKRKKEEKSLDNMSTEEIQEYLNKRRMENT